MFECIRIRFIWGPARNSSYHKHLMLRIKIINIFLSIASYASNILEKDITIGRKEWIFVAIISGDSGIILCSSRWL